MRVISALWRQRELIAAMTWREIASRYRGSVLGAAWGIVQPLLMLVIYALVFTTIFNARWGDGAGATRGFFALALFAGLIPFQVFAEIATRAPMLIVQTPNLVKKVVFPLEILPLAAAKSALAHSLLNVVILIGGVLVIDGRFPTQLWFLPLAYIPLALLTLTLGWMLSALGVYLRDTGQVMPPLVQMLMFLTPIFYPATFAPPYLRGILQANPLAVVVDGFRHALLPEQSLSWMRWGLWSAALLVTSVLAYGLFMRLRRGFADAV